VAADRGPIARRVTANPDAILPGLVAPGEVTALTRTGSAVIEKVGV
jgi:putative heme degradation protein